MAIIYTYPTKATPVDADLILISDSADSNKTKQVTVASIKGQTAGVTSVAATLPLVASAATGDTTLSLSGLSALGTAGQVIKVNSGATALEFGTVSGGDLPIEEEGSQITAAAAKINFTGTGATASASGNDVTVDIPAISIQNSGVALISGITTLDFGTSLTPTSAGPGSNKVTIDASSGGISFSGSTANGIATYSSATQANVSSAFTVSGNKLSAPAGTLADPSLEVGAVGGLYAASGGIFLAHSSANAIGVNSSSIVNYKLTQFDSGLKFGSSGDTLSDYDVGTWSPKIQNVGGTVDYDTGTGSYTIIGDVVHADFSIPITATVSSTYFRLSVPFTPAGSISAINLTGNADPNTGADSTGWVSGKTISIGYGIFLSYATTNGLAVSNSATITNGNTISGSMTYKK